MEGYLQRIQEMVLKDLGFCVEQLDLMGRVLSLEENSGLVRYVKVDCANFFVGGQPVLFLREPREIGIGVALQRVLRRESNDDLKEMIRKALVEKGIQTQGFFSYCTHSYGIELEGVNIHFGFSYD